jgi:ABC-type transport system involved in Fe-S cluster assembly fused permease/ATPase subunit
MRHEFKIYSSRLFDEMNTFVYVNGRPDHQKGQHDDLIMSIAMATYVAESSFSSLEKVTEQTKAMLESWSVSNNEQVSKHIEFNPVIPFGHERINQRNQNVSKEDYMKYSWLFGGR